MPENTSAKQLGPDLMVIEISESLSIDFSEHNNQEKYFKWTLRSSGQCTGLGSRDLGPSPHTATDSLGDFG